MVVAQKKNRIKAGLVHSDNAFIFLQNWKHVELKILVISEINDV